MKAVNSKNIAIIIPGGIGTGKDNIGVPVLEQLIKHLSDEYSITVFSLFKVNDEYTAEGFELVSIPSRNFFFKSLQFLLAFRKHHHEKEFRIVHGFWTLPSGFLAVVAGKIFTCKSVISVLGGDAADLPEINYGEMRRWLPGKIILWSLHYADQVVVLTQFLKTNLERYGLKRDVKIIPWGIDTNLFAYREKQIGETVQFLHIANLSPVKDQVTLLKAFHLIHQQRPSHLTIIGSGVLEGLVNSMIKELQIEDYVTLLKPVPYNSIAHYYHNSDILLHTSLSEGQSEVVTEAMSCGTLVCGTSVGLLYDLPDCCLSVQVGDAQSLAVKVLALLTNDVAIKTIRLNAYAWSSAHSIHWTKEKIFELYKSYFTRASHVV